MPIGGWDMASVMNYCNPDWLGDGNLSPADIAGVQLIYGSPTTPKDSIKSKLEFIDYTNFLSLPFSGRGGQVTSTFDFDYREIPKCCRFLF